MSLTSLNETQVAEQLKETSRCLIRTDVNYGNQKILYKVSRGSKGKLFTLWLTYPNAASDQESRFYCGRLGNDIQKALRLAAEIVLKHAAEAPGNFIEIEKSVSSVTQINRGKSAPADEFPFGKYKGLKFSDVSDNGYKEWLLPVLADKGSPYKKAYRELRRDMVENHFTERNGYLKAPETIEKEDEQSKEREKNRSDWEALKENSRFRNEEIGSNVSFFRAYLLSETSFNGKWGPFCIQVFKDDHDRVYKYAGKGYAIEANKGEPFYVRGKIKDFTTYKGICQTELSRLVVLDKTGPALIGETAAKMAKSDGYTDMPSALENTEFKEEVINTALEIGTLTKKDKAFARYVIKEVLSYKSLP